MNANFNNAMGEVLNQRRYDQLTGRAVDFKQIIADAAQRLLQFILDRIHFNLPEISGYNTDIFAYFFIVLAVLVLMLVTFAVIRLLSRRKKTMHSHDLSDIFEEIAQKQYTVNELITLSENRATAGNIREAVRYRYIAMLVSLDENQIIRIEKSKTNAILLAELNAAAPMLSADFTQVVDCFHTAWFGHKPVHEESYALFVKNADKLLQARTLPAQPIGSLS